MITDVQTDASLNKTSTNINDSNVDNTADDTSFDTNPDLISNDKQHTDSGNTVDDMASDNIKANDHTVSEEIVINDTDVETMNIGKILKEKRIELEFDERHIATGLKISVDQVQALESNDFKHFRSVTFARGFLKSYCRLLGLEHSDVIDAFDARQKNAESTIKPVDKVHKQTNLGDPIVIFISIVIVAVLAFLVFWWPTESVTKIVTNDQESVVEETTQSVEVAALPVEQSTITPESSIADELVEDKVNVTPTTLNSADTETASNLVDNLPAKVESPVKTNVPAKTDAAKVDSVSVDNSEKANIDSGEQEVTATSAQNELGNILDDVVITFNQDCWTEIRDSSGTILFSGVKSAGSELSLTANPPYRVVLGYASGVSSLKYKGEEFDFSSFTRKDLARFELK